MRIFLSLFQFAVKFFNDACSPTSSSLHFIFCNMCETLGDATLANLRACYLKDHLMVKKPIVWPQIDWHHFGHFLKGRNLEQHICYINKIIRFACHCFFFFSWNRKLPLSAGFKTTTLREAAYCICHRINMCWGVAFFMKEGHSCFA